MLISNHVLGIFSPSTRVFNLLVLLELKAKRYLLTTTPKILVAIWNVFDERFGLPNEDMEVRNVTSVSNEIMPNMCAILNNHIWGTDYITGQRTVPTFGKQTDAIKFICSHFRDLYALENLNVMQAEGQFVQFVECALCGDVKKFDTSNMLIGY